MRLIGPGVGFIAACVFAVCEEQVAVGAYGAECFGGGIKSSLCRVFQNEVDQGEAVRNVTEQPGGAVVPVPHVVVVVFNGAEVVADKPGVLPRAGVEVEFESLRSCERSANHQGECNTAEE